MAPAVVPRWTFHPSRFSRATSVPTCTPPYDSWNFVEQLVPPEPDANPGTEAVPFRVELLFKLSSPPTPRTHTPPPSCPGCGLAGALTKAVLWVRNAVFAAVIDDEMAAAAPTAEPSKP